MQPLSSIPSETMPTDSAQPTPTGPRDPHELDYLVCVWVCVGLIEGRLVSTDIIGCAHRHADAQLLLLTVRTRIASSDH